MECFNSLNLTTEPIEEPITTAEAKLWMKQDFTDDDTLIASLIKSARKMAEQYCNRAFVDQSWTLSLNCMPGIIPLPKGYIDSVTSVKVIADDGTSTTEAATKYQVKTGDEGKLVLESGQTWTTSDGKIGVMEIEYVVGYGDSDDVPDGIKTAIKQLTAYIYENREMQDLPRFAKTLLEPYRIYNI